MASGIRPRRVTRDAGKLPCGYAVDPGNKVTGPYCQHTRAAERLTALVENFRDEWLGSEEGLRRFDTLLKKACGDGSGNGQGAEPALDEPKPLRPEAAGAAAAKIGGSPPPWKFRAGDEGA